MRYWTSTLALAMALVIAAISAGTISNGEDPIPVCPPMILFFLIIVATVVVVRKRQ